MNSTAPVPIMAAPARPHRKYSHFMASPPNLTMCRSAITWRVSGAAPPSTPPGARRRSSSPLAPENSAMPLVLLMWTCWSAVSFQP